MSAMRSDLQACMYYSSANAKYICLVFLLSFSSSSFFFSSFSFIFNFLVVLLISFIFCLDDFLLRAEWAAYYAQNPQAYYAYYGQTDPSASAYGYNPYYAAPSPYPATASYPTTAATPSAAKAAVSATSSAFAAAFPTPYSYTSSSQSSSTQSGSSSTSGEYFVTLMAL